MMAVNLIFPHQLFKQSKLHDNGLPVYLLEECLFFKQYPFHQQKLAYHRASMQAHADYLTEMGIKVHYIEAQDELADVRHLLKHLHEQDCDAIHYINCCDDWLERRIKQVTAQLGMTVHKHQSQAFLNSTDDLKHFFKSGKKKFLQATFYKQQRKKLHILVDDEGEPTGGQWSFDADNRKKYPKGKSAPTINYPAKDKYFKEASDYVSKYFNNHLGVLNDQPMYPHTQAGAEQWLDEFLTQRFVEFGPYEDAIVSDELVLNHSVLTPMLNTGLLTPEYVIKRIMAYAEKQEVPLNSLEGLVRQIIGWREFIRGMYLCCGRQQRTVNYWQFDRQLPESMYTGETGIKPVDDTIRKVLKTGYCHHIERLMILGNFMLLCEFDPDAVYQWFMELFIDAYDWVMVPNVYGMSQFADGGLMATKPYISGSNYILKMSDYSKGSWCDTWDALFWRFMHKQRSLFSQNPRLAMLLGAFDKKSEAAQQQLIDRADAFLAQLDQ